MEWKKKKETKKERGSKKRKLEAGFLHVCLPGHYSVSVIVCMFTRLPVCLVNSNHRCFGESTTAKGEKEVWKNMHL